MDFCLNHFENHFQLQTDDNRTIQDIALNPKVDPSRLFQKNFMPQSVDILRSHMIDGQPVPQLHRAVKHKFILSKPYDESLPASKNGTLDFNLRKPIVTSDPNKNDLIVDLLKEFVAERKSVIIFVEGKSDSENLGRLFLIKLFIIYSRSNFSINKIIISAKLLLEREHEWNEAVGPDRQIRYKSVENEYEERTQSIHLVDNMDDSKLVKISSYETQESRERVIVGMRNGTKQVLLSTNVCSRGLDLPNIDCIIQYNMPTYHDSVAYYGLGSAHNDFLYR